METGILAMAALLSTVIIYGFWSITDMMENNHFTCKNCGSMFTVDRYKLLMAFHCCYWQYLKCPSCQQKSWMAPDKSLEDTHMDRCV